MQACLRLMLFICNKESKGAKSGFPVMRCHRKVWPFYFILSSEINAYKTNKSEIICISLYFHCYSSVCFFWITSDFSIHLMHFISELQTPITLLLVNEHIKCGYAFS